MYSVIVQIGPINTRFVFYYDHNKHKVWPLGQYRQTSIQTLPYIGGEGGEGGGSDKLLVEGVGSKGIDCELDPVGG